MPNQAYGIIIADPWKQKRLLLLFEICIFIKNIAIKFNYTTIAGVESTDHGSLQLKLLVSATHFELFQIQHTEYGICKHRI